MKSLDRKSFYLGALIGFMAAALAVTCLFGWALSSSFHFSGLAQ